APPPPPPPASNLFLTPPSLPSVAAPPPADPTAPVLPQVPAAGPVRPAAATRKLKCPNPSCPYVFDPAHVPAGVVLSCPRCAMRFTLGSPTPPAPPASHPTLPFPGPVTESAPTA